MPRSESVHLIQRNTGQKTRSNQDQKSKEGRGGGKSFSFLVSLFLSRSGSLLRSLHLVSLLPVLPSEEGLSVTVQVDRRDLERRRVDTDGDRRARRLLLGESLDVDDELGSVDLNTNNPPKERKEETKSHRD